MANEIVASALLLIASLAVSDRRGWRPDNGLFPLVNGLVIVALVMAFYANGPVSMNPSRDLAPRLFTYLAGWGEPTFRLVRRNSFPHTLWIISHFKTTLLDFTGLL